MTLLIAALMTLVSPDPVQADLDPGVCVLSLEVDFNGATLTSGAASVSFENDPSESACAPAPDGSNIPSSMITTIDLSGGGGGLVRNCELTQASGTYSAFFGAGYQGTAGQFVLVVNIGGGVLTLVDLVPPNTVGIAQLSLDPLGGNPASCLSSGLQTLSYTAVLTFSDP